MDDGDIGLDVTCDTVEETNGLDVTCGWIEVVLGMDVTGDCDGEIEGSGFWVENLEFELGNCLFEMWLVADSNAFD